MSDADKPTAWRRLGLVLIGSAAGGAVGYGAERLLGLRLHEATWSDALALVIATVLILMGLVMTAGVFVPSLGQGLMRAESLSDRMKRVLALQAATTLLAGGLLAVPPLLSEWVGGAHGLALVFVVALTGMFALQTWINIELWRKADEFYRRAMLETSAISFWVLQGALFLWAAAEKFRVVPSVSSWDCVAVLMTVYLVLSVLIARRLGADG